MSRLRQGLLSARIHGPRRNLTGCRLGPKRIGWREHGILVIAEQDPRLAWPERALIRQLGTRLYGHRKETPGG